MKRFVCLLVTIALFTPCASTQSITTDVLGSHDLTGGTSTVKGSGGSSCQYCHAPHSGVGGATPLWSQRLSNQTYNTYSSPTEQNTTLQPVLGADSSLCLSCHDGTVAVGTSAVYGSITTTGSLPGKQVFGGNLQTSHPVSLKLPIKDSPDLVATLASNGTTNDPTNSVKLVAGNVECTTCHNPHIQNIDKLTTKFLVRDNINGGICLTCHETGARTVSGVLNPLAGWAGSAHATAGNAVSAQAGMGAYTSVAQFACQACHMSHNATTGTTLLRMPIPAQSNFDNVTQNCLICHNGGSNLTPAAPNVGTELAKSNSHPTPSGIWKHSAAEPVLVQNNRHAACVDCHNSHDSLQVTTFPAAPVIRASQTSIAGISAVDGTTIVSPAQNQYENCLRCHGTSSGKQTLPGYMPLRVVSASDRLNVIPEFALSASSSHPVMHDSNSPLPQPSLRPYMLNLDGATSSTRGLGIGIGSRILCTDCHNSDDNREFGGSGPNGPHGSANPHVLERRYEITTAPAPGFAVNQLWPQPSLNSGGATPGPYALCGKCHNLVNIMTDASFQPDKNGLGGHNMHVSFGFSCSVCHTSHGMGARSPSISGERLVNFDANVVAALSAYPISYDRSTNTCTLTCHGYNHYPDGSVFQLAGVTPASIRSRSGHQ